jgi:formylglycine-generating enzyme required for sulfatase activity
VKKNSELNNLKFNWNNSAFHNKHATLRTTYLSRLVQKYKFTHPAGIKSIIRNNIYDLFGPIDFYIPLSTVSVDIKSVMMKKSKHEIARRFSALELLNKHDHLIILGDPGSGKSMLLNFVLLCLAGESLGLSNANLKTLVATSVERGRDESYGVSDCNELWKHGALIPIYIQMYDFAAIINQDIARDKSSEILWKYIETKLHQMDLNNFTYELREEIIQDGGVLMLDGLDEIFGDIRTHKKIKKIIEDFTLSYPKCRVILTCRNSTYQKFNLYLEGFSRTLLSPFSKEQIIRFTKNWFEQLCRFQVIDEADSHSKARSVLDTILTTDEILDLAQSPLLISMIVSLKSLTDTPIPKTREQLYCDSVELLYSSWKKTASYGGTKIKKSNYLSLSELLNTDVSRIRNFLNENAYLTYKYRTIRSQPVNLENNLVNGLQRLGKNPRIDSQSLRNRLGNLQDFLFVTENHPDMIPHESIRAFLASCWLTKQANLPDVIKGDLEKDPEWWQEVIYFATYYWIIKDRYKLNILIRAIWSRDIQPYGNPKYVLRLLLAGRVLVATSEPTDIDPQNISCKNRVKRGLLRLINSESAHFINCCEAGDILDKLEDPRFDSQHWFLAKDDSFGFNHIPAGKFWMGSDETVEIAESHEKPIHQVYLSDFWISRYPVTFSQFKAYSMDSGRPINYKSPGNHPAVYVTWFDALEYCNWLQKKLIKFAREQSRCRGVWRKLVDGASKVVLPSEAEWEKACRGTDRRVYPWPNQDNLLGIANMEMNVGSTSSVGSFGRGVSPFGIMDMAGNVWEWTRSIWGSNWESPDFNYPYFPSDGREQLRSPGFRILRGGCFLSSRKSLRSSSRLRLNPTNKDDHIGFRVAIVNVN